MTSFLCMGRILLGFNDGSKLTWFLYVGRKSVRFGVRIEIDLVFVWMVEIDFSSVRGIELVSISV